MHPSTISSEPTSSGLPAPQPSSMRVPLSGTIQPNSDDNDDDNDDVRLTRSQSRASASASVEAGAGARARAGAGHYPNPTSNPECCDLPPADPASSSSQPKTGDTSIPTAAALTEIPNMPFSVSLTLRNTGSVARDHLASERTFLAYVRTSLSFASAGVALVQLFRVSVSTSANSTSDKQAVVASYARPLGATLIAFGMAVLVMGTHRYFLIQRALPQGLFPAARLSVFLQATSLATLVGIVFGILVAVR